MITRSQSRRAEQPLALCSNPSGGGSPSSDDNDPLQRSGDVFVDQNEFVGGLSAFAEGSQVAFGETSVPYNISKCHSNHNCKLCLKFNPASIIVSSSTNRTYKIIIPTNTPIVNCATMNCIYLITCVNCFVQYVGETEQTLQNRFNLHRSSIRNANKPTMCKRLCNHFQKGVCKNADYKVEILEVLKPGTTAAERRKKETEWILKLRTAYLYGLNGKIGEQYHRFDDKIVGIHFPTLKRLKPHPNRSRKNSFVEFGVNLEKIFIEGFYIPLER